MEKGEQIYEFQAVFVVLDDVLKVEKDYAQKCLWLTTEWGVYAVIATEQKDRDIEKMYSEIARVLKEYDEHLLKKIFKYFWHKMPKRCSKNKVYRHFYRFCQAGGFYLLLGLLIGFIIGNI